MFKYTGFYACFLSVIGNVIFSKACYEWDRPNAILSLGVCFLSGMLSIVGLWFDNIKTLSIISFLLSLIPFSVLLIISQ